MHIGALLLAPKASVALAKTVYYTPWFPRQAENAWFTYQVIQQMWTTGGAFTVSVFHKNLEDRGDEGVSSFTGFADIGTSTGFMHLQCVGLKELVRFKLEITSGGTAIPEGLVYRFLTPTWYDKAV